MFGEEGFEAVGEMRLLGASVGAVVDLSGGKFRNSGGNALSADGARITGGVFCREGFRGRG